MKVTLRLVSNCWMHIGNKTVTFQKQQANLIGCIYAISIPGFTGRVYKEQFLDVTSVHVGWSVHVGGSWLEYVAKLTILYTHSQMSLQDVYIYKQKNTVNFHYSVYF